MTAYVAFDTEEWERLELTGVVAEGRGGRKWTDVYITYRRRPYELPITESICLPLADVGRLISW